MERAASFDRFDELLAHRDWVRRVARALTADDASADDLEQDVWLLAARAERPRSPRAWLGTVLRNTASNLRTAAQRRERRESAAREPRGAPSPEEMLERTEIVERVARAVRTLEEPYRTAVFLRYFEDLAPPQIAARLGEPLETVRTRLRRALAMLRQRLDADHGGDRRAWMLLLGPVAGADGPAPASPLVPASVLGGGAMLVTTKLVLGTAAAAILGVGAWWVTPETESAFETAAISAPTRETADEDAAAPRTRPRADVAAATTVAETPAAATEGEVAVGRVVDDVTGAPVAKASVRMGYGPDMRESALRGVTDDDGRFRVEGIGMHDAACHKLLVEAEGYAEALPSINGWHQRAKPGEPTDLGEFRLERGARVAGRVLSAGGAPVPRALVLFCRDTTATSPPTFHPNESREVATTDAAGRFAIEHVPSALGDFQHTLFALTADEFGWVALPRVAGKKDLADVELRMARTTALTVNVRSAGAAVVCADVLAIPHFPPLGTQREWKAVHDLWIGHPQLKPVFGAMTGATGTVRLGRLPLDGAACTYDLAVRAEGFAIGVLDGVRLEQGDAKEVTIELTKFKGATVTGTVRAADGNPIAGAEVNFSGTKTLTATDGTFRFDGIDPARHDQGVWLVVEAPGFAKVSKQFRLPASGEPPAVDVILDRAISLAIRVVDEAGAPVKGSQITLRHGRMGVECPVTDIEGRVHLQAAPGEGRVLECRPPSAASMDFVIPDDVPVPVRSGELEFVLRKVPPTARVVAEVVDAATGKPLDPTNAMLCPLDWKKVPRVVWNAPALESGRIVVDRAFPGDHLLWVAAAGRAPSRVLVHVDEGQTEVKVVVRCAVPGTVRGVVDGYGARGRGTLMLRLDGVESAPEWVQLQSDPKLRNATRVADDGTFRIEGAPPGRLRLWMELDGSRVEDVVEVQPGAVTDVVLRPVATGRATFRAAESGSVFLFRLRGEGGEWGHWTAVSLRDDASAVWTTNTPLGRVTWEARRGRGKEWPAQDAAADATGEFDARAGETVDVTIPAR